MVEIWSDMMCPFCWLGKRRFELAVEQSGRDDLQIVYRSFQLNPALSATTPTTSAEYLSSEKGIDPRIARQLNDRVAQMGAEVGLHYDFERALVVNTFNAHRVLHVARKYNRQASVADRLFRAHFSEGRNVADLQTLVELGVDAGLDRDSLTLAIESGAYADDVRADIAEANALGIHGVPFFVFDRKVGVSGAQDVSTFREVLAELA